MSFKRMVKKLDTTSVDHNGVPELINIHYTNYMFFFSNESCVHMSRHICLHKWTTGWPGHWSVSKLYLFPSRLVKKEHLWKSISIHLIDFNDEKLLFVSLWRFMHIKFMSFPEVMFLYRTQNSYFDYTFTIFLLSRN